MRICGLSLVNASLGSVVGLLGIVKRALLIRKVRLGGIALGGKVLDRSRGVVIRLIGLFGLCLGGIAGAASLRLVSSGLGCLRLAVSKRGVCLIESCLGSSGLGLGGIEVLLEGLDVDSAERVLRGVVCRLRGGGAGLSLLVLALGGVHVRVGCGIGVLCAFLIIESSEICRIGRAQRLLRLGELALELLELRLLRLRAASVIGRIDVVVDELLELGNSEISLSVISAVIEYGYLGIGVLTATGRDADSHRSGIDNVEIVPAGVSSLIAILIFCTVVHIVIVLVDIVRIIAMSHEIFAGLAIHTVLFNPILVINLLLSVETGVGPAQGILGLTTGICTATTCEILSIIEVTVRVIPNIR